MTAHTLDMPGVFSPSFKGITMTKILSGSPFLQIMGIEHPIYQAGMYQVAYGWLAAAVSKAGGSK